MIRALTLIFMMISSMNAFAFFDKGGGMFKKEEELLVASEAFQPSVEVKGDDVLLNFNIQNDYHIYLDQLIVKINGIETRFKGGHRERIEDDFFGSVDVFKHFNSLKVENNNPSSESLYVQVEYQGCAAELKVCYPIEYYSTTIDNPTYDEDYIGKAFDEAFDENISYGANYAGLFMAFAVVFVSGVLVSLTPCVYPMIPIITGIVLSNKKSSPIKLTTLYVLGISLCYASIFAALEMSGINISSVAASKTTSIVTGLILILLSLVVIGIIGFQMPSAFQGKINSMSDRLAGRGAWAMIPSGYLSALVVSPCATAPLAGVFMLASNIAADYGLVYGVFSVMVFGFALGIPMIMITTFLKKYMPKSGSWMNVVKNLIGLFIMWFGFGMLVRSMSGFLSDQAIDASIGVFTAICIFYFSISILRSFTSSSKVKRVTFICLSLVISIAVAFISVNKKASDKLYEVMGFTVSEYNFNIDDWIIVKDKSELMSVISNGKKSIVFVSADWCVICDQIKKTTLSSDLVINELRGYNRIYVDITNNGDKEDVVSYYGMRLAPYFVFHESDGGIYNGNKFFGYTNEEKLLSIMENIN